MTALTVGCAIGMAIFGILEFCRSCIFIVLSDRLARRFNIPTLKAAIGQALAGDSAAGGQALRDLNELRHFVTGPSAAIPLEILWTPALVTVLFMLHPGYGVYGIGCAAILLTISLFTDLVTRTPLAQANSRMAKSMNDIATALRNTETLDGLGMLPAVARRWQRTQNRTVAQLDRVTCHGKAFAVASKMLRLLMQAGVIALGVMLVMRHEASPGSMMGASLLIVKLLIPFEGLITGFRQWVSAASAWQRVRVLLARDSVRRGPAGVLREGRLVAHSVSFTPEGARGPVLSDVSFVLEPGEALGIVGPSGVGKSTLARLLAGVLAPSSGEILLDGNSTFAWDREDFGRHVGYVPQSIALLDGTIFENIARMSEAEPEAVIEAANKAGVHDMIGRLPQGYATWIGGAGLALSGGQKQRIALARALFGRPRLVILDEPNSNLDHFGEQAVAQAIADAKQAGTSIVVIAHRPAILHAVDKVLALKDGTVELFGARDEVLHALSAPPVRLVHRSLAATARASA
jgi:ATP-binding cassette subfamily C protein